MSTATTLGRYRDELVEAGFTREEALDLVGHAAPMGMDDLATAPARACPRVRCASSCWPGAARKPPGGGKTRSSATRSTARIGSFS